MPEKKHIGSNWNLPPTPRTVSRIRDLCDWLGKPCPDDSLIRTRWKARGIQWQLEQEWKAKKGGHIG